MSLKAARVNARKTQHEAAAVAGVSKRTLQKWENGKSLPNVKQFFKLCALYGADPNDIQFLA